ncbi:MAG: helix-turn-helix domain-containing protein [Candidatus Cloacimonetes bacterium]|nr:helix-turn-helix domain-containing protein [Candidatus Cloacimonadota bacterium]
MKLKLAQNVAKFRKQKGLSQAEISELAQLPRTTWTHIESGSANPSLETLLKVSKVLHVSLDELISEPVQGAHHLYRANEMETLIKSSGAVEVFKLLPQAISGVQLERFEMNAKALMKGSPHQRGSIEYLVCIQGQISIYLSGTPFHLFKGDVFVFEGDQAHSYKNNGNSKNSAISAIVLQEDK